MAFWWYYYTTPFFALPFGLYGSWMNWIAYMTQSLMAIPFMFIQLVLMTPLYRWMYNIWKEWWR